MLKPANQKRILGFTLIELLVVISIIGFLSTVAVVSLNSSRKKARDAKRLADMRQIQTALALYHDNHSQNYPQENSSNGSWEESYEDNADFIDALKDEGYMATVPVDPINSTSQRYSYYVYPAGNNGCDSNKGEFYVLGIRDLETSGRPADNSPGWSCSGRNWQDEFDWVTGAFEK